MTAEEVLRGILAPWPGPNAAYLTKSSAENGRHALAALVAERQQAIDALREIAADGLNDCGCMRIARAALLNLGEQP